MKFTNLTLLTTNLGELKHFYSEVLELPLLKEERTSFVVQIGSSAVTFKHADTKENPVYHFAVNIPSNKFQEAKSWLNSKVILNKEDGQDEVFFESWNAHAVYFEDPSGNIVEFIARHNLKKEVNHPFSAEDLLNISEIGIVVNEVIPFVRKLNEAGIPNWREDSEALTPAGDEQGLFITVKEARRWFFTNKEAHFFPFEVSVEGMGRFLFNKEQGEVIMENKVE
ncbi:putative ring-cleavage extradiol dioxygenase [Alkalihalophilus pseudofirmus OF4]|uniref:Ring-cleavage extradiol dioxygenase n=1 Tax=Alkalihalophilus pseudofirmus (strain ATCC BAA-2126 / JCM 17055 / OF4) TaxID=398511 RepID=D3FS54_ALKPO|nr:ring-cleavage extradiol dioxygenase [Alkalihalophilus pseudofirmus]ADC51689.1 putative ring-cleavage extradiol dioxygenase [Alkalihalophilus pseudofirmus OF4]